MLARIFACVCVCMRERKRESTCAMAVEIYVAQKTVNVATDERK